ncbi:MAG: beta-galactosidase [Cyclobacteriaceae bacterium]|nr:beta-galactosidase [Cyclobacteriaceae bacterium]
MRIFKVTLVFSILFFSSFCIAQKISYVPPEFRLSTEWTLDVNPDNPHPEYPRPGMTRPEWKSLNGRWHFAKTGKEESQPEVFDREIIVPFPVESALSGIYQSVGPEDKIWYKRTFFIPESWSGRFILLNFGASDWETTVYINETEIGKHRGGYDPFSFDISSYLDERGVQEIVISVWDPTDTYHQPRGKQKIDPKGIWYTPVSGIWQTVWIEPVNLSSIESLKCTPDIDNSTIKINANLHNPLHNDSIRATVSFNKQVKTTNIFQYDQTAEIVLSKQKLWSPDHPNLYDIQLDLIRNGKIIDRIQSYFGMRKISVDEDKAGIRRLFLNNKPIFQYGLLDQGWWPDGLYTAPTDEALKSDIQKTKDMGFNLIRKHVKVEPDRWYTYCDQIGMIVWQDMPNSDKNAEWKGPSGIDGVEIKREFISEAQYKIEFEAIINSIYNHPSIVKWIPFNEGWGQFKTTEIYDWVVTLDSSRLIGGPSGGNFFPVGDTRDYHKYPGPEMPPEDNDRALILGEFGGLGLPVDKHLWQKDKNWGYRNLKSQKDLTISYLELIEKLQPLINDGLAGAIYTQTTDVEGEVNGTMTYDRKVIKLKSKKIKKAHEELFKYFEEVVN